MSPAIARAMPFSRATAPSAEPRVWRKQERRTHVFSSPSSVHAHRALSPSPPYHATRYLIAADHSPVFAAAEGRSRICRDMSMFADGYFPHATRYASFSLPMPFSASATISHATHTPTPIRHCAADAAHDSITRCATTTHASSADVTACATRLCVAARARPATRVQTTAPTRVPAPATPIVDRCATLRCGGEQAPAPQAAEHGEKSYAYTRERKMFLRGAQQPLKIADAWQRYGKRRARRVAALRGGAPCRVPACCVRKQMLILQRCPACHSRRRVCASAAMSFSCRESVTIIYASCAVRRKRMPTMPIRRPCPLYCATDLLFPLSVFTTPRV